MANVDNLIEDTMPANRRNGSNRHAPGTAGLQSPISPALNQQYVLGFMFNEGGTRVLLTLKNRPKLLAGQWNGIGGKMEQGEISAHKAMKRECWEETGLIGVDWRCFAVVNTADGGVMWVFSSFTKRIDFAEQQPGETEPIQSWLVSDLPFKKPALRHNVPWMVHMAICCRSNPRYAFKVEEMHK